MDGALPVKGSVDEDELKCISRSCSLISTRLSLMCGTAHAT